MGKDFSLRKALDVAREEERDDHVLLQLSGPQVDAVSSCPLQNGGSSRRTNQDARPSGGRPPQASVQDRAGTTLPACASSYCAAVNTSCLATPPARAGACYHSGSTRRWANSTASLARRRTCSRCGRRGHFAQVCRTTTESTGHQGTWTVTYTVTVLQVHEKVITIGLIHLSTRINGLTFTMLIDISSSTTSSTCHPPPTSKSSSKRNFSHIKLLPSNLVLQNYSEQAINNHCYFKAAVSYNVNCAPIPFYITDKCTSLLRLVAIRALKLFIGETLT
ncbi:hypothetical protein HPB51_022733 [Rhipicephalus microplus]|uniref:CCHC-type domain-containing protein n=1 Tax=Rhipicephalus microplus TaxID=6941 RepID=A0A9J6EIM1_RHIMP|nr:hypothetical protein HPB51_022733 [Rhipicephalus microplus]